MARGPTGSRRDAASLSHCSPRLNCSSNLNSSPKFTCSPKLISSHKLIFSKVGRTLRPRCSLGTAWAGKIRRPSLNKTNLTKKVARDPTGSRRDAASVGLHSARIAEGLLLLSVHTHSLYHTHSLSISLSLTHTHKHTHTLSHSLTLSLSHTLSLTRRRRTRWTIPRHAGPWSHSCACSAQ